MTDYLFAQAANIAYKPYLDPDEIEIDLAQEKVTEPKLSELVVEAFNDDLMNSNIVYSSVSNGGL